MKRLNLQIFFHFPSNSLLKHVIAAGNQTQAIQPIASHYTDQAVCALCKAQFIIYSAAVSQLIIW
jgi:hypothetical protein